VLCLLLFGGGQAAGRDGFSEVRSCGLSLLIPDAESGGASALLDTLVALQSEVAQELGDVPIPAITIYAVRSDRDFHDLTQNRIPHWGVGVAYPQAKTIVLRRRAGQSTALLQTARHEFSHILLHHAVPKTTRIPVWFNEGLAVWVAREWRFQQSFKVAAAALSDGLIPLRDVDAVLGFGAGRAHLAYDQSYLAVLFIVTLGGESALPNLIDSLRDGVTFDVALYRITRTSPAAFETAFAAFVGNRFGLQALLTSEEAIWLYIVMLVVVVWLGVRHKNCRTIARWDEEDTLDGLPLRLRAKIKRERE